MSNVTRVSNVFITTISSLLILFCPLSAGERKGGARACSVEATGMPRGITRGTPQADADLETTRAQAPIGRSGRLCTAVLGCVSPFERLPVFRQKTMVFYHIPLEHTSRHRRIRKTTKSVTAFFTASPSRTRRSCERHATSPDARSRRGDSSAWRPWRSCRQSREARGISAATDRISPSS